MAKLQIYVCCICKKEFNRESFGYASNLKLCCGSDCRKQLVKIQKEENALKAKERCLKTKKTTYSNYGKLKICTVCNQEYNFHYKRNKGVCSSLCHEKLKIHNSNLKFANKETKNRKYVDLKTLFYYDLRKKPSDSLKQFKACRG